jgi:hypothetical protein
VASEWVGVVGGLVGGIVGVSGAIAVQTLTGRQQASALKAQQAEARRLMLRDERKVAYQALYRSVDALGHSIMLASNDTRRIAAAVGTVSEQMLEAGFVGGQTFRQRSCSLTWQPGRSW